MKVILTGATGMVGEGVLLECLAHPQVKEVLMVNRRPFPLIHAKLRELIVPNFFNLEGLDSQLIGFDACFFCAGISSIGMKEPEYTKITYDTTLHVAKKLLNLNPEMTFNFVSGAQTDSSEKGKSMWARVKGKTENDLAKLSFKKVYNFRPGLMKPTKGQKNVPGFYKIITFFYPAFALIFPNQSSLLSELGVAMINSVLKTFEKQTLEVNDIKLLASR